MTRGSSWNEVLALHDSAITEFTETASKIPAESWANAPNETWAPAHVTEHLALVYEVLLKELAGGAGMKVRTNYLTQRLLRWFIVPKMLRGGPFPRARAPHETRPVLSFATDQTTAIETLRQLAGRFRETIQELHVTNPGMRLSHAYFGTSNLDDSLLLCARHIQHHAKRLKEC
jgi:hypothetical protein